MTTPLVETEQFYIVPLTQRQLKMYSRTDFSLEEDLGVKPIPRTIPPALTEALEVMLLPTIDGLFRIPVFFTLWTIIHKKENVIVGDLCFKGEPNDAGEIEVGYGTYDTFQNRGYMTEALRGVIQWAFDQPRVACILAETEQDNLASQRTLLKLNFEQYQEVEGMLWWRLKRPGSTGSARSYQKKRSLDRAG
ncbi:GNAT family N-acetyltransferase [Telluribacter sp. SYSU D00476]|uniref:GNAT family N-acetyltransferase n=1 Tax=Telluribacter sp. SYSU D00476 TaxID=2811430 RepID=UPI001FF33A2B|nr:GNAT family N-acetyltransferase [Telluribacter sp. SYSU D00476]